MAVTRDEQMAAVAAGLRQEWKVTFYEVGEDGERKTGDAERAHVRYVTVPPTRTPRAVAHSVFTLLDSDPSVPEIDPTEYDIERTVLVTAQEDNAS
ncbi:hypothetical protein [Streptomyces yaizuensis]|uniref:Uncharacterized protein n=1 Tax=Streptomyces yaizuensis TaxID=2989713 RepID=A0AA86IXV3_9ACTN|nr:hypothetical protein [Streptomyces sp. YSPA8]BDT39500.1 hypothetical protein SYYSPA8_36910 [Streptomyces sp. YSPA8]